MYGEFRTCITTGCMYIKNRFNFINCHQERYSSLKATLAPHKCKHLLTLVPHPSEFLSLLMWMYSIWIVTLQFTQMNILKTKELSQLLSTKSNLMVVTMNINIIRFVVKMIIDLSAPECVDIKPNFFKSHLMQTVSNKFQS